MLDLDFGCVLRTRKQGGDVASPDDSDSESELEKDKSDSVQNLPRLQVAESSKASVHRADSEDVNSPTAHLRAPGVLLGRISIPNSMESPTSQDSVLSPVGSSVKHPLGPAFNESLLLLRNASSQSMQDLDSPVGGSVKHPFSPAASDPQALISPKADGSVEHPLSPAARETQAALISPESGVATARKSPEQLPDQFGDLPAAEHSAIATPAPALPNCQEFVPGIGPRASETNSALSMPSALVRLEPEQELDLDAQFLSLGDIMACTPTPAKAILLPRCTSAVETDQVQSLKATVEETACTIAEGDCQLNPKLSALAIDIGHPDHVAMKPDGETPQGVGQFTFRRMKSFSTQPQAWITPSHVASANQGFSDCMDFASTLPGHGLRRASSKSDDLASTLQRQKSMFFLRLNSDLSDSGRWETSSMNSESPLRSKGSQWVVQPSLVHTITSISDGGSESLSGLRAEIDRSLPNTILDQM